MELRVISQFAYPAGLLDKLLQDGDLSPELVEFLGDCKLVDQLIRFGIVQIVLVLRP